MQLGASLLAQKKYTEAEPLLVQGYARLKQRRDKLPTPFVLAEALELLVRLYDATGQTGKAAAYREQLAEVKKHKP